MDTIINSLVEFIDKVALHRGMTLYSQTVNSMSLFRGQSNAEWKLEPSVFRGNRFMHEAALLREFERKNPLEFQGRSNIEKLIKMQHYGLPTRLLDFSQNPLVALYFACMDLSTDGAVFALHGYPTQNEDFVWISILMKCIFEYEHHSICLESLIQEIEQDPLTFPCRHVIDFHNEKEILRILNIKAWGILPKMTNPRIAAQEGAFLLMGSQLKYSKKVANRTYYSFECIDPQDICDLWKHGRKYVIPKEAKEQILFDLRSIGIHEGRLFPELPAQARYIENLVCSTNWTMMGELK